MKGGEWETQQFERARIFYSQLPDNMLLPSQL